MNVLGLFSGIGGMELGLQRAGMRISAMCEIDPYCRRVLRKHWPDVPIYDDVRELNADDLAETIDVICGGFPCQDISEAGRRAGIGGARSGLWVEYARIIGEVRPRYAIVENVAALLRRGMGQVLGDLAEIGYDAEWRCVGADRLGASQHRERIWILVYPHGARLQRRVWEGEPRTAWSERQAPHCEPLRSDRGFWPPGPLDVDDIPRMADGSANRVDRIKGVGNAVVPEIPEIIGRAIMDAAP